MRRFLLIVCLVIASLPVSRASALSCVDPRAAAQSMDAVVDAQVIERPSRQEMRLQVAQYYKGAGPELIWVRLEGIDGGTNWLERDPAVGTEAVIGLRRRGDRWVNQPCDPFVDQASEYAEAIMSDLGPGQQPAGEPAPRPIAGRMRMLASSAVVAAVGVAAFWFWRRNRSGRA